jgi:hypothetical protein
MAYIKDSGGGYSAPYRAVQPKTQARKEANAASAAYTQAAAQYAQRMTGQKTNGMPASVLGPMGSALTRIQSYQPAPGGGGGGGGYSAPQDNGDYYAKLKAMKESGIMSEYESNAAVIKNNLAKALANLKAEKAALAPVYQNQLTSISQNQFGSGEKMKEMMNQAGWTGQNSGIAIGEQGKIKIGADTARADAAGTYSEGVNDANRRMTLAKQISDEEQAALEKWKANQLSGAEAEAWVANQERLDKAVTASQNYAAKMATASSKQKANEDTKLTAAQAKAVSAKSSSVRRSALADARASFNKGDIAELLEIQAALADHPELSDADYNAAAKELDDLISALKKGSSGSSATFNAGTAT